MGFTAPSELLNPATASSTSAKAAVASYLAPAVPGQSSWRLPKKEVDKRFIIQV
jgi:hypothetical protein